MVVFEINNIKRLNDFLYYRQEFSADAVYSILGERKEGKIKFSIENTATGEQNIGVTLLDSVDYPVLQIMSELKQKIYSLMEENQLPE